jgi:glycerophosphoryl diester phosphodiesterase
MKIIGHRGARGLAPENTAASIQKALDHGAWMVEFDVRVTRDGVPVLHHDAKMKLGGKVMAIKAHSYAELADAYPGLYKLDSAMKQISAKACVDIEVKAGVNIAPIAQLLKDTYINKLFSADQIYVSSKHWLTLKALHDALPELSLIVVEPWSGLRATYRARKLGTSFICMNQLWLWSGFIKAMNRRGYKLLTYTLNNPSKARRWFSNGLFGMVTDYPDRFSL